MSNIFDDVRVIRQPSMPQSYERTSNQAYTLSECWNCGGTQMAVVAFSPSSEWLRCVNCLAGLVRTGDTVHPHTMPLSTPQGLEGRELEVWTEVRMCLGSGAYTAAVMLCRKLLMHVAVGQGLPEKNDRGRAPTFEASVKYLAESGVVTSRMNPWIDRIRSVGNGANHELEAITSAQAHDVARFTEQLLRLAYEMDALMAGAAAEGPEDDEDLLVGG